MPVIETGPDHLVAANTCLNCRAALAGPYCAQCGQKDLPADPTLRELAVDGLQQAIDVDGRLLRSIRLLFTRPGFLSAELFAGRRATYVSPFRLYLVFSLIAVTAAAFASNRALIDASADEINVASGFRITFDESDGPEERRAVRERVERFIARQTAWLPRAMFAFVPVVALAVMGMTRGARRHFPQHFQFTLHLQAIIFAAMTIEILLPAVPLVQTGPNSTQWDFDSPLAIARFGMALALAAYATLAFRTAYRGGWIANALRAVAIILVYQMFNIAFQIGMFRLF
jgi:hypothetical protein